MSLELELDMLYAGEVERINQFAKDVEDADNCRTQSSDEESQEGSSTIIKSSNPQREPVESVEDEVVWWVSVLEECARSVLDQGFPRDRMQPVTIGSACTGCSAEAAVLKV